jgi:HlyD family secretion protein
VAFGSTKTDNVVTYTTYMDVDNTDLSLRPGMTAAAVIVSTERTDVLLVPNPALRFSPAQAAASAPAEAASGSFVSKLMPRMPRTGARRSAGNTAAASGTRQIWVLKDGQAVAMTVQTGISDGRMTEVSGAGVQEGLAVITDQRTAGAAP